MYLTNRLVTVQTCGLACLQALTGGLSTEEIAQDVDILATPVRSSSALVMSGGGSQPRLYVRITNGGAGIIPLTAPQVILVCSK